MGAPKNAEAIGNPDDGSSLPDFQCQGCGGTGNGNELLGVEDDQTLWCPYCGCSGWEWV